MTAFSRIQSLPPEKLEFVNDWLLSGKQIMALARYIKNDWKIWDDCTEKNACLQLSRYRDWMAIDKEVARKTKAGAIVVKAARGKNVDVVERLCALISIQENRLQLLLDQEAKMKLPMKGVNDIVDGTRVLLMDLQKVRFDLGLDDYRGPVGGKMGMRTTLPDGTVVEAVMSPVEKAAQQALEVLNNYVPQLPEG